MPPRCASGASPLAHLLVTLLALFAATPALAQFGPQGPPAVGIITAERRPVTETSEFVGRVEATDRVDLRARVTGFLQERTFNEGQEVKAGDLLFRIERAPFEAEVQRQQAQVAAAEASLINARISLDRARELLRTQAGAQSRVDDATAQERTANAQLLGAQAALRAAVINLNYTEITSPIAGKIGRANLSVGNVVGPDAGVLATVVSQDPMRVAFPVSQRQALELRSRYEQRGGPRAVQVRIRLTTGEMYGQVGRIDFIDNQVDRNTDTILIRALMPNPARQVSNAPLAIVGTDRELVDGQFVTVLVEGTEPVLVIGIPRAAVLQDQQGNYVFVVAAENKAERRNIRLGRSTAELAVVEQGLEVGDKVITEGIQRVRPGQPVNPAPAAPPAGQRPSGGAVAPRG